MAAADELKSGNFDIIEVDYATHQQATVLFGWIDVGVAVRIKVVADALDDIERQPNSEGSYLPSVKLSVRHVWSRSNPGTRLLFELEWTRCNPRQTRCGLPGHHTKK
jgi:hypothetical protein